MRWEVGGGRWKVGGRHTLRGHIHRPATWRRRGQGAYVVAAALYNTRGRNNPGVTSARPTYSVGLRVGTMGVGSAVGCGEMAGAAETEGCGVGKGVGSLPWWVPGPPAEASCSMAPTRATSNIMCIGPRRLVIVVDCRL